MKRFLSALCSYLIAFSPVMARDIVSPRSDEDIRIITKPGGTPTTSMRVDGSTGVPEVDSIKADSVEEKTSDNGVSIDGVTLKDGVVTGSVEGDATIVRTTGDQSIGGTKTFSDGIVGPGSVPIGGMVAVMPTIDAATWQPPATGAIKDGFMRADGHQITAANVSAGSVIPEGVYLPNMVSMVARGGTASCDGSIACQSKTGGNDSVALVSGNLPNHTHSAGTFEITENHFDHGHSDNFSVDSLGATNASLANGEMSASEFEHNHSLTGSVSGTFASTTHTHNLPKHYHSEASHTSGLSTSVTVNNLGNGTSSTSYASTPDHYHKVDGVGTRGYTTGNGWKYTAGDTVLSSGQNYNTNTHAQATGVSYRISAYTDIDHGHSASGSTTGYVGEDTGGCNGDLDTGCDTTQLISGGTASVSNGTLGVGADNISTARTVTGTTNIAHGHGLSGSVTAYNDTTDAPVTGTSGDNGNPTPSNVSTLPAYQQVVWVIRVK